MNREEMNKKSLKWWDALKEMQENGVISSDQHNELDRQVREWWIERRIEIEEGVDKQ